MDYDTTAITRRIEQALARSGPELAANATELAFHMTDWADDLAALQAFYAAPDGHSDDQVRELLMRFLLHAPAHLAAASRLYTGEPVADVFGVGATESGSSGGDRHD